MNNPQYKIQTISDQEFKMLSDKTCDKYDEALKRLAREHYRIVSDEKVKRKFSELDKRYCGLYDDLAKI